MRCMRLLLLAVCCSISTQTMAEAGGSAHYMELMPAFIVNVSDANKVRHMQITAQLKLSGSDIQQFIEQHNAAIRHEMVMLLSGQPAAELRTVQGKEKLRQEALTALQKVMQENIGAPGIEAVYFTGLIIQ